VVLIFVFKNLRILTLFIIVIWISILHPVIPFIFYAVTRWIKYDRDDLCVNKSQFVPVIFEPPCTFDNFTVLLALDSFK
jgi:hypothetical protein